MVKLEFSPKFKKAISKIQDKMFLLKIQKQITKIVENQGVGKPMRNVRKETREVYVKPYRLSYGLDISQNVIYLLDVYHKKKQ